MINGVKVGYLSARWRTCLMFNQFFKLWLITLLCVGSFYSEPKLYVSNLIASHSLFSYFVYYVICGLQATSAVWGMRQGVLSAVLVGNKKDGP